MSRLCPLAEPNEAMSRRGPDGSVAPLSRTRARLLKRPTTEALSETAPNRMALGELPRLRERWAFDAKGKAKNRTGEVYP